MHTSNNNPHKYLFPQDLVMLYLLWCLKTTVIFALHFTGLATKFLLLMVLFHNLHPVDQLAANHTAQRRRAASGLTVLFCDSHSAGRLTLFMMSKCFPCLFIKKHQAFCIGMMFCSIQVAHTRRRKYLPVKATDAKAEQAYSDRSRLETFLG